MTPPPHLKRFLAVLAASLICAASGATAAHADPSDPSLVGSTAAAVSASVDPWLAQQLSAYAGSTYGPYENGVWNNPNTSPVSPWSVSDGPPASVAATLYVLGGETDPEYLQEAEATINTAIASEQGADGGFVAPSWDGNSEGTTTLWFGVEEGTAYELLSPYLDPITKAAWRDSLAAAGNYLISSGSTTWYANGNLNIGYTELLWMAWQASGESALLRAYNQSWSFVLDPPQNRWTSDGWYTVATPTSSDGADGEGYFAESGSGGTGWDPYYSTLQLDILDRLYLFSGDPRALQAANMIMNLELPLLNTSSWVLNTSDGTRHTGVNQSEFLTSAFAVLGLEGGRTDLLGDILPHLQQYEVWYRWTGQTDNPAFRRAFGNSIGTIALAAAYANPAQRDLVSQYGWLGASPATATPVAGALTPASIPVGNPSTASTPNTTTTAAGPSHSSATTTPATPTRSSATSAAPTAASTTSKSPASGAPSTGSKTSPATSTAAAGVSKTSTSRASSTRRTSSARGHSVRRHKRRRKRRTRVETTGRRSTTTRAKVERGLR